MARSLNVHSFEVDGKKAEGVAEFTEVGKCSFHSFEISHGTEY